ncbi:MAG: alpha/beta fold hydrolase [Acidiferrobacterales bacterium]
MYNKLVVSLLYFILVIFSLSVQASDLAKEKRWAEQTVDSIMTGDAVWLKANGQKFLAIYTEPTTEKKPGGVIVLHGLGAHPNWVDVVQPLRTRLPETGWFTLSLQMPILDNKADYKDYKPLFPEIAPRINAGLNYLKSKGVKKITIIGHSMGATMAGYYVANNKRPEIRSLVAIGAVGHLFKDSKLDYIQSLKKITVPVLDISGSDDFPSVVQTKKLKAKTAREAGNKNYYEVEIKGANHFLVGKEDELVKEVDNWLKKYN